MTNKEDQDTLVTELGIPFIPHRDHFSVTSILSSSHVNFKLEQFQTHVTIIKIHAILGSVQIDLPQGVIVKAAGSNVCLFGSFDEGVSDEKKPDESLEASLRPIVIVDSRSLFGCVSVKKVPKTE